MKRGKISQDKHDAILTSILTVVTNYDALSDVDLVIEAVFEEMAVKKKSLPSWTAFANPVQSLRRTPPIWT